LYRLTFRQRHGHIKGKFIKGRKLALKASEAEEPAKRHTQMGLPFLLRMLGQHYLHVPLFFLPRIKHRQSDFITGLVLGDGIFEILRTFNRLPVQRGDNVPWAQAGLGGGPLLGDTADDGTTFQPSAGPHKEGSFLPSVRPHEERSFLERLDIQGKPFKPLNAPWGKILHAEISHSLALRMLAQLNRHLKALFLGALDLQDHRITRLLGGNEIRQIVISIQFLTVDCDDPIA
jgi:hypothetical protein